MSESLWPQGLQHPRLSCPPLSPGACSNSCPLSRWCHPTVSSSAILVSFCLQSSSIRVFFQWVGSLHQVAKVLELWRKKIQMLFYYRSLHGLLHSFCECCGHSSGKKTTLEKNLAVHFLFYLFTLFIWLRWVSAAARGIFDVAPGLSSWSLQAF